MSDIDSMFAADNTVKPTSRTTPSGVLLPQNCPVCDVYVASKMALVYHLKHFYSGCCPYQCVKCSSHFNNGADLSCYNTNVYSGKRLQCKMCEYRTVNRSQMCAHVHTHKGGLCCDKCKKLYLTERSLVKCNELHGKREEFACGQCSQVYVMRNSLHLHLKGKYGDGFRCKCGACFDSTAQHKRHERKCDCVR